MNSPAAWALGRTVAVEDDVTGSPALRGRSGPGADAHRVFVPSMMGVGILLSLALLAGDALRALTPGGARARQRLRRRRRAVALVAPMARAVGLPEPTVAPDRRRLRSRSAYIVLFVVGVSLSLYVAIGSTANYLRPGGYLEGVVWVEVVAVASSLAFMAVALLGLVIAWRYPAVPSWAGPLLDRTPLGVREP